jgi:hypothetical protein
LSDEDELVEEFFEEEYFGDEEYGNHCFEGNEECIVPIT